MAHDTCCVGNAVIALVAAGDICWLSESAGSSHLIILLELQSPM